MLIRQKKSWEIEGLLETPEAAFLNRRALMQGALLVGGAGAFSAMGDTSAFAEATDPTASLYPAKHNPAYVLGRALTPESVNANYNNFYEYGTSKRIAAAAQELKTRPWSVKVDGLVETPKTFAIDDLIRAFPLEGRLYRHRCVEAWAMTIPWTGFPLKAFVEKMKPKAGVKYIHFETFNDPKMAPGQEMPFDPWPYTEGLTMAEAMSELPMLVTGAYGKPLLKQFGAPIRLAVPWKYGFKSIKSITRITFSNERPKTFWEQLDSSEYGFWANVNPAVPHPRWSQATERVLGTMERVPTVIFNGYGEQVAGLYKDIKGQNLYR